MGEVLACAAVVDDNHRGANIEQGQRGAIQGYARRYEQEDAIARADIPF